MSVICVCVTTTTCGESNAMSERARHASSHTLHTCCSVHTLDGVCDSHCVRRSLGARWFFKDAPLPYAALSYSNFFPFFAVVLRSSWCSPSLCRPTRRPPNGRRTNVIHAHRRCYSMPCSLHCKRLGAELYGLWSLVSGACLAGVCITRRIIIITSRPSFSFLNSFVVCRSRRANRTHSGQILNACRGLLNNSSISLRLH